MKLLSSVIFLIVFNVFALAQPHLDVEPETIEFEDEFYRFEKVYLINNGNQQLRIDSISYKYNSYFIRFNSNINYPFFIAPNDTVSMDCILSNYFTITNSDTADTMFIYNNGDELIEEVKIKVDFFEEDYREAQVSGQVTSSGIPLGRSRVHFLYDGNFILNSIYTDANGFFSILLPAGFYTVAAEHDNYYVVFYNGQFDPLNASLLQFIGDSTYTINFDLTPIENTGNSIMGTLNDSISMAPLRKGLVVIRKGTHTPAKPSAGEILLNSDDVYTAVVNYNGEYKIDGILTPDYYFVQAFSQFFVPAYYSSNNIFPAFWQTADSVLISGSISNKNFSLKRDSSTGGGIVSGSISLGAFDENPGGVVIYAQSLNYSGQLFNFAFPYGSGSYSVNNLPYGNYKVVAQKIGFNDAVSQALTIDTLTPAVTNIALVFQPLSVNETQTSPVDFILNQNYPNPFNPSTVISWQLPTSSQVSLKVYDILGRETATLVDKFLSAGNYEITFNAGSLSSGTYFVRLTSEGKQALKKIILIK
jgi:hypothetical protein